MEENVWNVNYPGHAGKLSISTNFDEKDFEFRRLRRVPCGEALKKKKKNKDGVSSRQRSLSCPTTSIKVGLGDNDAFCRSGGGGESMRRRRQRIHSARYGQTGPPPMSHTHAADDAHDATVRVRILCMILCRRKNAE